MEVVWVGLFIEERRSFVSQAPRLGYEGDEDQNEGGCRPTGHGTVVYDTVPCYGVIYRTLRIAHA